MLASQGKNAACSELIISREIDRVVVGQIDPNPKISNKGINLLRNEGIKVECWYFKWRMLWAKRNLQLCS